jgi:hypothetical protein
MFRASKSSLLIEIGYRGEVTTEQFKVGVELAIVGGHLHHPEMKIRYWRKTPTSHQDQRGLIRVILLESQTVGRKCVVFECLRRWCGLRGRVGSHSWSLERHTKIPVGIV